MPRVKHAFQIILAGHAKSLCDRYPGYENVTGDDTKVTCKVCLREMEPHRLATRTRALKQAQVA